MNGHCSCHMLNIIKQCTKCKTENPSNANYCRHCGVKLEDSPNIESFNYMSVPHVGDSIELSWSIKNADSVILNGQTMPLNHRHEVVVDKEMTWELVATKSGKKESKRIHIVPIPVSDKSIQSSAPTKITPPDTLPYLAKVLLTVLVIDIAPVISLLIISFCSSWLRYTLNLSYNEWKNFSLYTNILLWIWIVLGIIWGCYKFYHYRKK